MDFLLRPCLAGLIRYESLKDGSLSLADVAMCNDALDVQSENQRRAREASKP